MTRRTALVGLGLCLTVAALPTAAQQALVGGGQFESPQIAPPQLITNSTLVLRAGRDVTPSFVRPQRPALRPEARLTTINVTYIGFSPAAQAAFQYAVGIWAAQITSTVPINVVATFTPLGPGVLGSASPANFARNFGGLVPNTWYPIALANKLTGTDLDPMGEDIDANFSSTFTWYYGTDGVAPPGTYDFVTVVLHELGHGLGFLGLMNYDPGTMQGMWGFGTGSPGIYDRFTENGGGQSLINTSLFPNPSTALGMQLTSNNLYFGPGPNMRTANLSVPARLYAPSTWSPGSSYSHLDETTYVVGNPDSLMTPMLNFQEAIHDPGSITRGIFTDMGWSISACSFALSSTSFAPGAAAITSSVNVTTAAGCAWTSTNNNPSFITITSGSSGTGNGTVNFSVASNVTTNTFTPTRVGTLTIAGLTFTVTQTGCSFGINPTSASYDASGGGGMVAVTAPAACTWTAVSNNGFLAVTGGTPGTSNGTVTYTVATNIGAPNVANAGRSGSITIGGQTFTVNQTGCTFSISPTGETFGSGAGSGAVNISTPAACLWTVTSLPAWASTTSGGSGTGSGSWQYTVSANGTLAPRSQTVAVAGQSFGLTQLESPLKLVMAGTRATFTLTSATDTNYTGSEVVGGRSYCAGLAPGPNATDAATPTMTALRSDGTTPLALVASGAVPQAVTGAANLCFVAPATETALFRVTQTDSSSRSYRLAVIETTVWANWFFIGGDYASFTLLHNTTAAPISATLTWRDATGAVVGSYSPVVPANGLVAVDARSRVSGATAGSVEVGHNGEPQAVVLSQTTLSGSTGLSFDTVGLQRNVR